MAVQESLSLPLITGFHHVSVLVSNLERSLAFYCGVLGFTIDEHRPDLGYPGAWLNIGATQIHLIRLPNPDPVADRPSRVGHDRHVALKTRDIDEVQSALQAAGVSYGRSSSGRRALFCRDPDGNGLEFVDHTHD